MNYNKLIDHTLLKATATKEEIKKLCEEAINYDFASVMVNSSYIPYCVELIGSNDIKVAAVCGFPLGAMASELKAAEAAYIINNGGDEVDMVMHIGALKAKDYEYVLNDIKAVREVTKDHVLKVIIETCLLSDEEIVKACEICVATKADFVKTSTGFSTAGANPRVVKIMSDAVKGAIEVKASGGVKTIADLEAMVKAGATRIGTSSGVKLMEELKQKA